MKKLFTSIFLMMALLAMTAGTAFAQTATPPITGTVQTIVIETNPTTLEKTVVVTLLDETTGTTQTVNLSLDTATTLGLVTTDATTGESTPATDATGKTVEIDPTTVIVPTDVVPPTTEETQHPVGSALSDFFGELLGVDYETIMDARSEGVGFGVIAQALWLTNGIDGGTEEFTALIDAKQSGDYSDVTLADGSTPDNWGDVVKSLKKGNNLGHVMSGKGKPDSTSTEPVPTEVPTGSATQAPTTEHGNGNNGNGNSQGNGNGNGNSQGNGNNGGGNGGGNSHKP